MTSGVDTLGRALTGAIAGILFAAGVSFSGGWLVSANTMQEAVADARIAALSEICERRAVSDAGVHVPRGARDGHPRSALKLDEEGPDGQGSRRAA